jgi:hypothetical protein
METCSAKERSLELKVALALEGIFCYSQVQVGAYGYSLYIAKCLVTISFLRPAGVAIKAFFFLPDFSYNLNIYNPTFSLFF